MLSRFVVSFIFCSIVFGSEVLAVSQIGSCRLLFAKNPVQEGKELVQQLQHWGFIELIRLAPSLEAHFIMIDNDGPKFQRWVDAKIASLDSKTGFPFYHEFIQALILDRTEMALFMVKSYLFEPYEASTIHDLLDLALYFNNQTLIQELSRPRNTRFLQHRLDSSLAAMARFGSVYGVKTLLAAGADVNKLNPLGNSPLMLAVVHRQNELVDLFMQQPELQINIQGNSFYTALSLAQYYKYEEIIEKIQQHPDIEN